MDRWLGLLAGRKALLLSFTTLERVGRVPTATAVPTSQTTTIRYRQRTEKRPMAANTGLIGQRLRCGPYKACPIPSVSEPRPS